jgi:hypothetical protein
MLALEGRWGWITATGLDWALFSRVQERFLIHKRKLKVLYTNQRNRS